MSAAKGGLSEENANEEVPKVTSEVVVIPRHIGLLRASGLIVSTVVGTGIFLSPRGVISNVNSLGATMIVWAFCGFANCCTAIALIELGAMIPKAGGTYAFVYEAFGPAMAFSVTWVGIFLNSPASIGIYGRSTATYILSLFFPACGVPPLITNLASLFFITLVAFASCVSVEISAKTQTFFSLIKISALLFIILTGLVNLVKGIGVANFDPSQAFAGTNTDPGAIAAALYSGYFAFGGWSNVFILAEEVKKPEKTLTRAVGISMSAISFIYLVVNMAYFTRLTPQEIASTPATALVYAQRNVGSFAWTLSLGVAMSAFGSLISSTFSTSRSLYRVGRDGQMPHFLAMIHLKTKVPVLAIMFNAVLAMLFHAFTSGVDVLIGYSVLAGQLGELLSLIAFFYFRWRRKDWHRPIKVSPIFPFIGLTVSVLLIAFNVYRSPLTYGIGLGIYLTFLPVYLFRVKFAKGSKAINNFMGTLTVWLQQLSQVMPEEKKHLKKKLAD